jgi:hypothetical protein
LQFFGGIGNQALGSLKNAEETSNTKKSTSKSGGFFMLWENPGSSAFRK